MEEKDKNIELFDQYYHNELPEAERRIFEKRLNEEPEFKEEFYLYLDIVNAIKAASEDHLRQKFSEIDQKNEKFLPGRRFMFYMAAAAAAVLIIMVGVSVLIKNQQNKKHQELIAQEQTSDTIRIANPEDKKDTVIYKKPEKNVSNDRLLAMNAYNQYYQQYPNRVFPKSRGEIPTDSFEKAMYFYDNQDYHNAELILVNLKTNREAQFYYALTLLSLDKNKDASDILLSLSKDPSFKFYYPSIWYAGLAFLKNNNIEKAKEQFEKLVKTDNPYITSAESILKILEQ